jgi:hypothetical protein
MDQHVLALYHAGDFAAASRALASAIGAAPEDRTAWRYLALAFVGLQQHERVLGLMEARQQHFADAASLFHDLLLELCATGQAGDFSRLVQLIPPNTILAIATEFLTGCLAVQHDAIETALGHFNAASLAAERCGPLLLGRDSLLSSIACLRQVLSNFADLDRLQAASRAEVLRQAPSLEPTIRLEREAAAGAQPFLCLVSGNALYLRRFGPGLIAALARAGIGAALHVHLVDGAAAPLVAELSDAGGIAIGCSSESFRRETGDAHRSASYYACARFARAGEIAAHYGKDLLILDMDVDTLGDARRLSEIMQQAELGFFSCNDLEPWLICRAAAVYMRRSPETERYNDLAFKYIALKSERQGFWGLDQAALWLLSRYVAQRHPPFRTLELSAALGTTLDAFAHSAGSTAEKQRLRSAGVAAAQPS